MKRLASVTGVLTASQALASLCQLGLQILVVRSVGAESYGGFAVALTAVSIVEAVFIARGGEMALQFVGSHWVKGETGLARANARSLVRADASFNALLFLAMAALAIPLSGRLRVEPWLLVGLSLMIPAQIGYGVFKGQFVMADKVWQQAALDAGAACVQSFLGAAGTFAYGTSGLVAGMVAATLLKNLAAASMAARLWPSLHPEEKLPDPQIDARAWIGYGSQSVLRNAFSNLAMQADILILNHFQGAAVVAVYKIAKMLAALPTRFAGPLWSALRPSLMRSIEFGRRAELLRWIGLPAAFLGCCLVAAIVMLWPAAPWLIDRIYGPAFAGACAPFMALLLGNWIYQGMTGWFTFWVIIKRERMAGTLVSAALLVSIVTGGILLGQDLTATAMAWIVSGCLMVVSAVCWTLVLARPVGAVGVTSGPALGPAERPA